MLDQSQRAFAVMAKTFQDSLKSYFVSSFFFVRGRFLIRPFDQAQVVRRVDNTTQRVNNYPVDKQITKPMTLSSG